jgi:hypothetical protein
MTNQEYLNHLTGKNLSHLKPLYEKIFRQPPPTKFKKKDIIQKLYDKFKELNSENPNAEEFNPEIDPQFGIEKKNYHKVTSRAGSRRSMIIDAIQEGIWDTVTLAEVLHMKNEEWPLKKNKVAVSGTIADLRKNKGWDIKVDDKGRICVLNGH